MAGSGTFARFSRRFGKVGSRLLLLCVIVAGTGVAAGYAVGYPLSRVKIETYEATQLDQQAIAGSFDPTQALVDQADIASAGFAPADPKVIDLLTLAQQTRVGTATKFCGRGPDDTDVVDNKLAPRVYSDASGTQFVISVVVRLKKVQAANGYIRSLDAILDKCTHFFRNVDGEREGVKVIDDRRRPLVTDYVNRTLLADKGGDASEVSFFQVGDSVVQLQYIGKSRPVEGFMESLERAILTRVDPTQFGTKVEVVGEQPLPPEATTTTVAPPPTTVAAAPPTEAPTTTAKPKAKPKPKPKPKAPASTAVPATPAPAGAPPAT